MRNKIVLLALIPLLLASEVKAQIRGNNITVTVQPDHWDWNYKAGEKATFTVNVLRSGTLLNNVSVDYEAGAVMYPNVKKKNVTLKDGTLKLHGSLSSPGFYRLKVTAHVNGKSYDGLCTAAFSPEKLKPYCQEPKDFDAFWSKALQEARYNDLNPTKRLLPERCTKDANVYEISYVNNSWKSRIYGILSVPAKAGKYPALLRVPGAGVRPYSGDTYTAPGKCIVLEIGIHGIPVTMNQKIYDDLLAGALNNYWDINISNPDKNYYKRVITGAVRAVDYIASLPEWNGTSLGVTGSSQGGFLSLAVAALDSRVTFLAAVHDAMCDFEAETHNVAGGWPHYFYKKTADQKDVEGARYYDGVNFARRCHVPAWFSFGYNDETVPPTSSYGLYNTYPAQKSLSVYQQTGHYWYQEQWDEWQNWICAQMNNVSPASKLIKRLKKIEKTGIMIGHQDDPFYGHNWKWEQGRSDVKEVAGDYPALMGFELGDLELGHEKSLDKVPFERIRQEAIAQNERGGIVEISWHPNNPVTGKNAWDPTGTAVKEILPGGSQHKKFDEWLGNVARFLLSIKDKNGKLIPIIFRPWHEMGGGWFWWGKTGCTPEEYKQLYIYTHDTFTKKFKLNNLVWGYSPNAGDEDFMKYYPGDKYVDLMGFDLYDFDADNAKYQANLKRELDRLVKICAEHKKIAALTETGAQQLPDSEWFTKVFWPVAKDYTLSYVLFWRNAWDNHKETYIPYPGADSEKDFRKFTSEGKVLLVNDIKNIK